MLTPIRKPFRGADIRSSLDAGGQAAGGSPAPGSCDTTQAQIDPAEALRNSWLRLWYQAKIDLKTMTVCGAEALLRARHPDLGMISPANFLPMSGSAIYQPLTKFVVMQAMADWANFAAQEQPLKLAINVPLATLQSPAFVDLIRSALPKRADFPRPDRRGQRGRRVARSRRHPGDRHPIAALRRRHIDRRFRRRPFLAGAAARAAVRRAQARSQLRVGLRHRRRQAIGVRGRRQTGARLRPSHLRHGGGERRGSADLAGARLPQRARLLVRAADGLRELPQDAARPHLAQSGNANFKLQA